MSMTVTGTFPEGIIYEGKICTEYELTEQTFRTTLEVGHDPAINKDLLDDEVYYSACIMSKRLRVAGIPALTPEDIFDISALDTAELVNANARVEKQRANFRIAAQAASKEGDSVDEDGASEVGDP